MAHSADVDPPFDINEATEEQLRSITGIGAARVKLIQKAVRSHGPFTSLQGLTVHLDPLVVQPLTDAFVKEVFDLGRHSRYLQELTGLRSSLLLAEHKLSKEGVEAETLQEHGQQVVEGDKSLYSVAADAGAEMEYMRRELRTNQDARSLAESMVGRVEECSRIERDAFRREIEKRELKEATLAAALKEATHAASLKEATPTAPLKEQQSQSGTGEKGGPGEDTRDTGLDRREGTGPNLDWSTPQQHSTPVRNGEVRGARYVPRHSRGNSGERCRDGTAHQRDSCREEGTQAGRALSPMEATRSRRRISRATASLSSEGTSESSSSSSEEEEALDERRNDNRGPHYRRPDTGKIPTYHGKVRWEIYADQFKRIARKCPWSKEAKLDNLVQHLREEALEFYGSLPRRERRDYDKVKRALKDRFNRRKLPATARRELQVIRQEADEEIEHFAQRCQTLARDGFKGDSMRTIERAAMDAFLHGCADRRAALTAGEKHLPTLRELVQSVRHSIHNAKAILGDRKVRAVSFVDIEVPESHPPNISRLEKDPKQEMKEEKRKMMEQMIVSVLAERQSRRQLRSSSPYPSQSRPRSASPGRPRLCYNCHEEGHFAHECPKPKSQLPTEKKSSASEN